MKLNLINKIPKTFRTKPVFGGVIVALFFLHASLLPSLLPRPWLLQGFVSGFSMAIGYGIGVGFSAAIRWFVQKEVPANIKSWAWKILIIAGPVIALASLLAGRKWQNQVRSFIGVESIGYGQSVLIVIATSLFFLLGVQIGRGARRLSRFIQKQSKKYVPQRVAVGLGGVLSAFLIYFLVSGVFVSTFFRVSDSMFDNKNNTTREGVIQPKNPERSGSPDSLIDWDDLGYQGRIFVGEGPSKKQIAEYTGKPAKEPIRIYAGKNNNDDPDEQAELALKDLKRAGGFDRKVLVIATPTGSGWIDPKSVDHLEFMWGGDTAIVTQQYSYLPSWISFLVDAGRARTAGQTLYDTIIDEWLTLPADNRPKLIVYGLSLGSFGGQEAFSGVNDMRRSVDGVLFEGTPNDSRVWRRITADRDKGTPEWQPTYNGGRNVVFASDREDILAGEKTWKDGETRILFNQHANDPIVWFSFDLIFNKPDWLGEKRGDRVSPATRYYPIVTFLHLGLDQMLGNSAPVGNGHLYYNNSSISWAAVTQPEGWTLKDSDRLQKFVDTKFRPSTSH